MNMNKHMINVAEGNLSNFSSYRSYRTFRAQVLPRRFSCTQPTLNSFAAFAQAAGTIDLPDGSVEDTNTGSIMDAGGNVIAIDNGDGVSALGVDASGNFNSITYSTANLAALGTPLTAAQLAAAGSTFAQPASTGNSFVDAINGLIAGITPAATAAIKGAVSPAEAALGIKAPTAKAATSSLSTGLILAAVGGVVLLVVLSSGGGSRKPAK